MRKNAAWETKDVTEKECMAMKKVDNGWRKVNGVDRKTKRKIFVQNRKINFGDMHKNIHLLTWV